MSTDSNNTIQKLSEDPPPPYHAVVIPHQSASHQHLMENRDVQCPNQLPPATQSQATTKQLTFPGQISFLPTGQAVYIITVPAQPANSSQPLLSYQYEDEPSQAHPMREGPKKTRGSQRIITDELNITDANHDHCPIMSGFILAVLLMLFIAYIVLVLSPI